MYILLGVLGFYCGAGFMMAVFLNYLGSNLTKKDSFIHAMCWPYFCKLFISRGTL